jgi:4-hydroxybenzoate polyprenyltransferase
MREFMVHGQLVFQLIVLVCAIFLLLVARGFVSASPDAEKDAAWRAKNGRLMLGASIVMILSTLVGILSRFL